MPHLADLRRYFAFPSRGAARIQREVHEELRWHIDMRADALERQGVPADEARARAVREFGDLDEAMSYCAAVDRSAERRRRADDWWSELRQDVGHALRIFRRAPAFTAATVATLALAIGASAAVYGVLHAYLVRPLPFPGSERLVALRGQPGPNRSGRAPSLENVDWSSIDSLFDVTVTWDVDGFTFVGGRYPEQVTGAWVSAGFFRALELRPAVGRAFATDEYRTAAPVAMISHDLWVRRFAADSGIIGATVPVHSAERPDIPSSVTIVGVLPRGFWPIQWRESDLLRPMSPNGSQPMLARLKPGMSLREAERRFDAIVRPQIAGPVDPAWRMTLTSARDRHAARVRPLLLAVFGASLFMLLAACGSVAGALVSRTMARRGELAVRLALGGGRARIVRQLLTESAVLVTLAGLFGVMIAYAVLALGGHLVERQLAVAIPGGAAALRPSAAVLLLSVITSAALGAVLGAIPALTFLRFAGVGATSGILAAGRGHVGVGGGARVRRVLVAGQVAVAMVLLFGAGLMFRTIARIVTTDLGFRVAGVATAAVILPEPAYADSAVKRRGMERLLARIAALDGASGAATVYPLPFSGEMGFRVIPDGVALDSAAAPLATVYTVSPAYFEVLDIPLRAGRAFRATDDHAAPLVAMVSGSLARRLSPTGQVIGRQIRVRAPYLTSFGDRGDPPWRTVIGVVADTKKGFASSAAPDGPDVYVPYAQNPRARQYFVVRTTRAEAAIAEPLRRATAEIDPTLALSDFQTMADVVADDFAQRRGVAALLGVFAAFSLGLSALALYASLSYTVLQRRSELAVRMAIGADARAILRLVMREGVVTAVIGVIVGAVASLALSGVLVNQLYGVEAGDPGTLVAIALVLALTAAAACVVPSLRAVRTDPALVFRE